MVSNFISEEEFKPDRKLSTSLVESRSMVLVRRG